MSASAGMTTGFDVIAVRAQSRFQPIVFEVGNVEPLFQACQQQFHSK